ncbi:cation:proton antiporter [Streptomyces sp. NBC_01356]|uniref:cation:proton antiporter n=1 Tax=Streptomyces sp. NBC_01356 TaxID=2903836 RepID=UPI002E343300|nr:cation:proton antiporter [Streptomyces sp. NBC_01356]
MPHSEWITVTAIGGIALILALTAVVTALCRRIKQPAVIGEITVGICLGPSLLGLLPGGLPERFFPAEIRPHLGVVSQVGLLLFMFIIGWEFNSGALKGRFRSTGTIWISSLALPMALGIGLAWLIYGSHDVVNGHTVPFTEFALYLGVAMSITAFPVLARIIAEQGLQSTRTGTLALGLAAADDLLAWCMLAVVVALTTATGTAGFLTVMAWSAVYVAVMLWLVRPALAAVGDRLKVAHTPYVAVLVAAGAFTSAFTTSHIGIHAIFGAFMFGLVMPRRRDSLLHRVALPPLESAGKLLLPVFFVVTGLSVDLTTLTAGGVLQMVAIIAVACLGKLGGVALSARLTGMGWKDATVLGVLMNTRGLTELVLLNVGLSLGLLTVQLFSAMVLMALVTTGIAAPVLNLLLRDRTGTPLVAPAPRPADGAEAAAAGRPGVAGATAGHGHGHGVG